MEEKIICDGRYKYKNHVIALPIIIDNLPKEISLRGAPFLLKPDLHVSLLCIGEMIRKNNIIIPEFEKNILNDFCDFCKTNNIDLVLYSNDFRFVVQGNLKSIIVMCRVSNLDKFFDLLNKKYSLNIEYPPTHITLYTPTSKLGIFVTDSSDIKNLTIPIENPIGINL